MPNNEFTVKVDDVGRILIPARVRKAHGIQPGDRLDLDNSKYCFVLSTIKTSCRLCGNDAKGGVRHKSGMVCRSCVGELTRR